MKRRPRHSTLSPSSALYAGRLLLITCLCVYGVYLAAQSLLWLRFLRPDQLFLILLFVLGIQKGLRMRLFLVDWLPFIVFVTLYDMMRSFAPRLYNRVHVIEPISGNWPSLGGWQTAPYRPFPFRPGGPPMSMTP